MFTVALTALVGTQVALAGSFAVAGAAATTASPKKQPVTLGFDKGKTVRYYDFGPIKLKPGNKLAPIWTFTNGAAGQRAVIDAVPGEKGYSPLWGVTTVTWAAGKTRRVLASADAVRKAATRGDVTVRSTSTVVNEPVLGFGQE